MAEAQAPNPVPTHLVVFKKASESNAQMLSESLGDRSPKQENGVFMFASKGVRKSSAKYMSRIGVAEIDMTDAEAQAMNAHDDVVAVERNTLMTIPRPIPSRLGTRSFGAAGPGGSMERRVDLPGDMAGYLRGVRDFADMLLGTPGAQFRPVMPSFPTQGAVGVNQAMTWGLRAIGVPNRPDLTGAGVKVAVLDTGLDMTHPDFVGRVDVENTASFVGTPSAQDGHGHGTHCCGTVAGPRQPSQGPRYGVAPDVTLLVGKVLSDSGSGFISQIIDGMNWAADKGAKIISMSLGSSRNSGEQFSRVYESVIKNLADQNVLVVVAAGNDSERPELIAPVGNPAACPSAMAVAALDENSNVAWFSCGEADGIGEIDISGPGVDVHSSNTGGGYISWPGTSMATPHVSGVAAMHVQQDPDLSQADLRRLLREQARRLMPESDFGTGLVQVPVNPAGAYY
ncbi:MAG: S8 family serine peptidase [Pseudomonadota bacterium]